MGLASRLPLAERTPACPPGTETVTRVDGLNGTVGVNISVSPAACQLPGTPGATLGRGDPAATGAEKVTWTGSPPSPRPAPAVGAMHTTRTPPCPAPPPLTRPPPAAPRPPP